MVEGKSFNFRNASIIWRGFISTIPWIGKGLIWHVGNGSDIFLDADPFVGMGSSFTLPRDLRDYLEDYGICSLAQARNQTPYASGYQFSAEELDLCGEWKTLWDRFIRGLDYGRIRLSEHNDSLLWSHNNYVGPLIAAKGYECIFSDIVSEFHEPVLDFLWTLNIPLKIACFSWLLVKGRISTWDQLQNRGFNGPSHCVLCERMWRTYIISFYYALLLFIFSHILQ